MSQKLNYNPDYNTDVQAEAILNEYKKDTNNLMKDVPVHTGDVYDGEHELNFEESRFLKNKTQSIIDSSKEFAEMLRKAAEKRGIDSEYTVASSLVDVHDYQHDNSKLVLNQRKGNRK